jgi:hypothetical protein
MCRIKILYKTHINIPSIRFQNLIPVAEEKAPHTLPLLEVPGVSNMIAITK